jgi:hypothetical protein
MELNELLQAIAQGKYDGKEKAIFSALNARLRLQHTQERMAAQAEAVASVDDGDLIKLKGLSPKALNGVLCDCLGVAPRARTSWLVKPHRDVVVNGTTRLTKGVPVKIPFDCVELVTKKADRTEADALPA